MAKKRVIAHFMHEYEREAARPLLSEETLKDGFWIANVDEADIPRLQKAGLFVRILKEKPQRPAKAHPTVTALARPAKDFYLMKIAGPLVQQQVLEDRGVQILSRAQGNHFRIRAPKDRTR